MKNRTATVSANLCAYSAAVIADAQAVIVRAIESVQRADNTRKQVKKQRESLAQAKTR